MPALFPYSGTGVLASTFGCGVIYSKNEQPWTKPVVWEPEDVYKLGKPQPTDGLLQKALELTQYLQEQTNDEYPIRVTDIQGPLDTASLVWNYTDFLAAMYTNPQEVQHLLNMVTDLIINFLKLQKSMIADFVPNHCPQIWVPADWGVSISNDLLAVVSPGLYAEFGVPYNNRIAEAFNGVHVHSCGDFSCNLANLLKCENLRGVDFGVTETPFENVVEKLGGKTLIVPRIGLNKDINFQITIDYLEHVLSRRKEDTALFILVNCRQNSLAEVYDFLGKKGIIS